MRLSLVLLISPAFGFRQAQELREVLPSLVRDIKGDGSEGHLAVVYQELAGRCWLNHLFAWICSVFIVPTWGELDDVVRPSVLFESWSSWCVSGPLPGLDRTAYGSCSDAAGEGQQAGSEDHQVGFVDLGTEEQGLLTLVTRPRVLNAWPDADDALQTFADWPRTLRLSLLLQVTPVFENCNRIQRLSSGCDFNSLHTLMMATATPPVTRLGLSSLIDTNLSSTEARVITPSSDESLCCLGTPSFV